MRVLGFLALAVALGVGSVIGGGDAYAQGGGVPTVTWGTNPQMPTAGQGSVTGAGGFTVLTGWSISSGQVLLVVRPSGGGVQQSAYGPINATKTAWGPATVSGLTPGTYSVVGQVGMKSADGTSYMIGSSVMSLNVP